MEHWHSHVSVSDHEFVATVAELNNNDDRLDFTHALGYHLPQFFSTGQHKLSKHLSMQKEDLKEEMLAHGPKGPRWDFVEFYEEICKIILKGDTAEGPKKIMSSTLGLVELELW